MKLSKLFSTLSTAALLTSLAFSPSAYAEGNELTNNQKEQKKEQLITLLQDRNNNLAEQKPSTFSALAVVNQAVYSNKVNLYSDHEYNFDTAGGTFTINHQNHDDIDYFIFNNDEAEMINPTTENTYVLPAGNYSLMVSSYNESDLNYRFELNGPFSGQPDTALPSLQVNSPASHEIRLSKGSSQTYAVNGTTDAKYVSIYSNNNEYDLQDTSTFNQNVALDKGVNGIYILASNDSGNSIGSSYYVTLPGLTRIAGKDRYAVSAGVSKELNDRNYNTGTIVIARGDLYPDALSGGPLAAYEGAPVLLTSTNSLPVEIQDQIKALEAERAIILGGTGSVSTNVESQLRKLGVTTIERIGGKDRFVVSADTAERVVEYQESNTAIIASGEVFPDALSASTIAGPAGMPILLVKSDTITDPVQTFIKNHPEIENFIVVGGPATVKDSVVAKLNEISNGAYVERIGGKDRYEVAINVAKFGMEHFGTSLNTISIVRGDIFPDALSGAPLANLNSGPILLTTSTKLEANLNTFLQNNQSEIDNVYIVGGTGSVSTTAEQQLFGHIR